MACPDFALNYHEREFHRKAEQAKKDKDEQYIDAEFTEVVADVKQLPKPPEGCG